MTDELTNLENTPQMQGQRLKRLRKSLGLSAQILADKLSQEGAKVSRAAITNWEGGKNGIVSSKLPILAKILNTTESYLLTGNHPNQSQTTLHVAPATVLDTTMSNVKPLKKSSKLNNVCYDIRGELLQTANRMEAEGQRIIKLNIGNPAPFGLLPPDEIVQDVSMNLADASGYSDSKGIFSARKAILQYYQAKGLLSATDVGDVFIGNGVSELIVMTLQALLDDGDEVLIPMPDYPLWTAAANLAGGKAVHYRCQEDNGWQPDLADIQSKITSNTKGIVIINPNNPTGALYSVETLKGIAELAAKYNLVILADEIYDRILYDDAVHTPMCTITDKTLVLKIGRASCRERVLRLV